MTMQKIVYLKVKIKSLAEEAKIIKKEEQKALSWSGFKPVVGETNGFNAQYDSLYRHRIDVVRVESRASQIAYGFLRGRFYEQIENNPSTKPDWAKVRKMVSDQDKTRLAEFDIWVAAKSLVTA